MPTSPAVLTAAVYVAVLLYPDEDEIERRNAYIRALREYAAKPASTMGQKTRRDYGRTLFGKRVVDRMNKRLAAGQAARDIVLSKLSQNTALQIGGPLTVREAVNAMTTAGNSVTLNIGAPQARKAERQDHIDLHALHRTWGASLPVAHFAAAIVPKVMMIERSEHGLITDILAKPEWVLDALAALPLLAYAFDQAGIVKPQQMVMLVPS